jgi:predicted P-loop ATPase
VGTLDLAAIVSDRDQLWAEAVALFRAGFAWWALPAGAAEQQEERFTEDSWQGVIQRWLTFQAKPDSYPDRLQIDALPALPQDDLPQDSAGKASHSKRRSVRWTTTAELLSYALHIDIGRHGRPEQMRIAHIMKRLGWVRERIPLSGGTRERRWVPRSEEGATHEAPF